MHVTFGLNLDARQGPSNENFFNQPIVGPMGFLSLLEIVLGLAAPEVSMTKRVTSYLGLLQEVDNGQRFYSKSIEADRVGTASKLLAWRDEWRLAGWDGTAKSSHPQRIKDMAAVEALAETTLPPGEAERLDAVICALEGEAIDAVSSVTLVDELTSFPWKWQEALKRLPAIAVAQPVPQGTGELRALQELAQTAVSSGSLTGKLPVVSDGSVRFVQSLSASTAEHWLSAEQTNAAADRLVVAEETGAALDVTLSATGAANCGFESPSPLRPALQALGLVVELCWSPLHIGRLLDFLTHPVGPIARRARGKLADAVVKEPGIGGAAWKAVKDDLAKEEGGAEVIAEIEYWLEGERWSRGTGIPVAALRGRVDRLQQVMQKRLSTSTIDASNYSSAVRQCAAVMDGLVQLEEFGQTHVSPREIEQLASHSTPGGSSSPMAVAGAGCMRSASLAGACIEPADKVIWWMPASPRLPPTRPWSMAEVTALAEQGARLQDPADELKVLARHWLRPLLAARKEFILVLPPSGAEEHPIRQLIEQICPGIELSALNLDAEVGGKLVGTLSAVTPRVALPDAPNVIQLTTGLNLPGKEQSYTSLDELFNTPALYTLKRIADLHPTSSFTAEEDTRLLGVLAHRVIELIFKEPDALTWTDAQVHAWFTPTVDELLRTEGAVLLMQGAGVSEQRFRSTCEAATCALLGHLRAAGATSVQTEVQYSGTLGGTSIQGKVDLVVELPGDLKAAIDMKWQGDTRHSGKLQDGTYLQLAIYSSLIEQNTGKPPAGLGYFIFTSRALYMNKPTLFPSAFVREAADGTTVASLLDRAKASLAWRVSQLGAGQIAVLLGEATAADQGPPGTLEVNGPKRWEHDRLVVLGGWE